jgi:pyruvate/2-oxoglutarate/acetoin dehydrogenase E1 component
VAQLHYRDAVARAMAQEAARDPRVVVAGADLDAAVRAARGGLRPVVEVALPDVLGAALDVPLVIRQRGGSGPVECWAVAVPGLKVVAPASPVDAVGLFAAAVRDPGPVLFFEHEALGDVRGEVPDGEIVDRLGRAAVLREGEDATILALSATVPDALAAAARLGRAGIDAGVVDVRSLVPLDTETVLREVSRTGRVFTVEERRWPWGWGSMVAAIVADECFWDLDGPVVRVAAASVDQVTDIIGKAMQS